MELSNIQPTQLYINKQRLAKVKQKFNLNGISSLGVIPIKKMNNTFFFTDGHTRAFVAYQAGFTKIPVIWEEEQLDWELYQIYIKWCKDEGIYSIADLKERVIDQKDYEIAWYKRCDDLNKKLILKRSKKKNFKNF